jgi:hypothetical protein
VRCFVAEGFGCITRRPLHSFGGLVPDAIFAKSDMRETLFFALDTNPHTGEKSLKHRPANWFCMSNRGHRKLRYWHALAVLLMLPLAALTVSPAAAHYHEACWVRVLHDSYRWSRRTHEWGHHRVWSGVSAARCNYLTGLELNNRIRQRKYIDDETYVLIIWPDRTRSIIQLSGLIFCGSVTEPGCAEALSGVLAGNEEWQDEYGRSSLRRWQICQSGIFERDCYKVLR